MEVIKTQKSKVKSQKRSEAAFTLMEILVSTVIIGIVVGIGTTSFFTLLRSAAKTDTLKEIKQNGDYVVSVIEIKLRNAVEVSSICDGSSLNSLTITNPDGTSSTFTCVTDGSVRRLQEQSTTTEFLTNDSVTVIGSCNPPDVSFTCITAADEETKTVKFNFALAQAVSDLPEAERTQQSFGSQVTLRN